MSATLFVLARSRTDGIFLDIPRSGDAARAEMVVLSRSMEFFNGLLNDRARSCAIASRHA
jgi:hypothetical protein